MLFKRIVLVFTSAELCFQITAQSGYSLDPCPAVEENKVPILPRFMHIFHLCTWTSIFGFNELADGKNIKLSIYIKSVSEPPSGSRNEFMFFGAVFGFLSSPCSALVCLVQGYGCKRAQ